MTIGSIAFLLAACEEYSQRFEEEYEFGPSENYATSFDGEKLTDLRDNFSYSVRKVGNLWWMMDDLAHPFFTDEAYKETYCYKDKEGVCDEIGRLYPGEYLEYACPKKWRLPTIEEWTEFFNSDAFREYTPRNNGASDLYKGYVDGEHTLNGYGSEAYYWTNSNTFSDSYIDCVHFKRDYSSSGELKPDYSSLETASLCHEQWKLAVRCVLDAGNVDDNPVTSSSSSGTEISSSSVDPLKACGDLWCGANDAVGQVETGSFDEDAGYWFACSDAGLIKDYNNIASYCNSVGDNGNSTFNFPEDVKENEDGNFFGPLIEKYSGIQGEVVLGGAYEFPYAYLAFDLVNRNRVGMDISNWGGLCLVYESTIDFSVELVAENDKVVTEYDNYRAPVSATTRQLSARPVVIDLPWEEFNQEGWGLKVNQERILSQVAAISIHFKIGSDLSGEFNIRSIGRLGTCK